MLAVHHGYADMTTLLIAATILVAAFLIWRLRASPAGMVFALDDLRMETAKQTARETLPQFWAAHTTAAPEESDFGLIFDLNHGRGLPDRELIWAMAVTCDADGVIHG